MTRATGRGANAAGFDLVSDRWLELPRCPAPSELEVRDTGVQMARVPKGRLLAARGGFDLPLQDREHPKRIRCVKAVVALDGVPLARLPDIEGIRREQLPIRIALAVQTAFVLEIRPSGPLNLGTRSADSAARTALSKRCVPAAHG